MNVGDIRKAIKDLPDEAAIRLYSIDEADGVEITISEFYPDEDGCLAIFYHTHFVEGDHEEDDAP